MPLVSLNLDQDDAQAVTLVYVQKVVFELDIEWRGFNPPIFVAFP